MPDLKYADPEAAFRYSKARDYPDAAWKAIKEMHRQAGDLVMDGEGIALRSRSERVPRRVLRWERAMGITGLCRGSKLHAVIR